MEYEKWTPRLLEYRPETKSREIWITKVNPDNGEEFKVKGYEEYKVDTYFQYRMVPAGKIKYFFSMACEAKPMYAKDHLIERVNPRILVFNFSLFYFPENQSWL